MEEYKIKYRTHVAKEGWYNPVSDGQISGTVGEHKAVECFRIEECSIPDLNFNTYAYVRSIGWSSGNSLGEDTGSTGLGLPIEAIRIELTGENAQNYEIFYRPHVEDIGFMNWAKNGEVAGTVGGDKQIEAIQIILAKRGENFYPYTDSQEVFHDLTPYVAIQKEDEATKRARVVAMWQKHIGYREVGGKSKFGEYFGDAYGAWCAWFFLYGFIEAGLEKLIPTGSQCPTRGRVQDLANWYLKHPTAKYYRRGTYIPKNGDGIVFDYNKNDYADHIGGVEGCDGKTVCAIEGNTSDMVKKKYYSINDSAIMGYIVPDFDLDI